MQSRTDITRARWQLWVVAFAIIGSMAGALILLATNTDPLARFDLIPSRTLLGVALAGMVAAFALYAVDRERNLHRLTDRLIHEQLESERLSARLHYLAELTRERDTNEALLEGSADGVAVVDRSLTLRRFNRAMEALCGREAATVLDGSAEEVLRFAAPDGTELTGLHHPLRAVFADGVARAGAEYRLLLPDGSFRWVSGTVSPIHDADGRQPVLALVTVRDIAQQKEQETMQRDFVSMAAHELRSPLTAIKGFTRTLMTKSDRLPPERRTQYLSMVNEQSNRLARLVDDLMQVSRIDSRRVRLDREPLDVSELARGLVEQFRTKWLDRRIEVEHEGDGEARATADPHKVEEILINLIDNAIKYSPPAAPVGVTVRTSADEVEVSVRDHGAGIAPQDLPGLFQKFHRLAAASTADVPGTGLGLYIVKGLVEAHGGRVWVDSTPGTGSTFTFTLPAAAIGAAETGDGYADARSNGQRVGA